MIVVTPKETKVLASKFNEGEGQLTKRLLIYLGGSVDCDWQSKVIAKIDKSNIDYERDIVVYNPRKMHGYSNPDCHELLFNESWKDKCLKKSDIIIVNFVPGHEDGLCFLSDSELRDRLLVFCPYDHKHFNTVKYICMEHGMHFVTGNLLDENDILESLVKWIDK